MAGGSPIEVFNAGAYNTTIYAKQGDLGSVRLPSRKSGTVWKRGMTATVRWQQTANHGGGYRYRICPASSPLTEACFQAHPLNFSMPATHTLRFGNSSLDTIIPATVVTEGGGIGWMRYPIPPGFRTCDYVTSAVWGGSEHCDWRCPGCGAPKFAADGACPLQNKGQSCADKYPGTPTDVSANLTLFPNPTHAEMHTYAIEDTLVVPSTLVPGDYVLGFRWDCEQTTQVWSTCADITIA
jgi:hypothetical protein